MQAALEQELEDLRHNHSQLLQSQSRVVPPPPGLHASPFGNQTAPFAEETSQEEHELNGHSSVPTRPLPFSFGVHDPSL